MPHQVPRTQDITKTILIEDFKRLHLQIARVIAQNTPESFAETVINLLNSPEKKQEMARTGRAHVEEYYSRKEIALKLLTGMETM